MFFTSICFNDFKYILQKNIYESNLSGYTQIHTYIYITYTLLYFRTVYVYIFTFWFRLEDLFSVNFTQDSVAMLFSISRVVSVTLYHIIEKRKIQAEIFHVFIKMPNYLECPTEIAETETRVVSKRTSKFSSL